jgi:hypothetical protein
MKKHIIILGIILSASVNAQTVDRDHFDEVQMNEVLYSQMSDYTSKNYSYPLVQVKVGNGRIYRFIKRNNDRLSLDDLNRTINANILRRFDSKAISQTDITGNVGMICRIDCQEYKTYQEIAGRCITEWLNSESLIFLYWSQIAEATSFYNRRTREVYIFWAYYN